MRGVRARLVLWNVAGIAVILVLMGVALRVQLRNNLSAQVDRELTQEISGLRMVHRDTAPGPPPVPLSDRLLPRTQSEKTVITHNPGSHFKELYKGGSDEASLEILRSAPTLTPVGFNDHKLPVDIGPKDRAGFEMAARGDKTLHDFMIGDRRFRSLSEPVRSPDRIFAVAQSVRDLGPMESQLRQLDLSLATLIPLALIVAGFAGWLLVGSAMRPLRRLTEAARNLEPDLSNNRLPIVGDDEFAHLAQTFNEAFDRTSDAFAAQTRAMQQLERFTGDAGHELRTPLGAIKGSVSFLLGHKKLGKETTRSLEIIDHASDRMTRLIGDLLILARKDGGQLSLTLEPVPLTATLASALELLSKPAAIDLRISVDPEIRVQGDAQGLARVFTNILENAFTHTRTLVEVRAKAEGEFVSIFIEDDGEGIAPEHLARLGERFYRPESARSRNQGGTGLGLSIAIGLVEAMDGSLAITSELGVGSRVEVRLRIAQEEARRGPPAEAFLSEGGKSAIASVAKADGAPEASR